MRSTTIGASLGGVCTSLRLTAVDGGVVVGRTMEFPGLLQAQVTVLPRGYEGHGIAPSGTGRSWTSTHGVVGVDAFGRPGWLTDGMNEAGLYAGLLYMPGFCDYQSADDTPASDCLSITDVPAFLLGTCATVHEARKAMAGVTVWAYEMPGFGSAPPCHAVLHDATGDSVVVEWRRGRQEVRDNPIGVATNAPYLDWHLTNLRNYVGLDAVNPTHIDLAGVRLAPLGQGVGMTGLPADVSPPSRFVRAAAYVASLQPVADGPTLEHAVLHVMNNFDIPLGFVRPAYGGDDPDKDERTDWVTVANLTDRHYVLRSRTDPTPRRIDLAATDMTPGPARQAVLPGDDFVSMSV